MKDVGINHDSTGDGETKPENNPTGEDNAGMEAPVEEREEDGQSMANQGPAQTSGFGPAFGFDQAANGGFPNMGFGGDFNQMQMMAAMQNGMGPTPFGNFPMMGMLNHLNINKILTQ